MEERLELRQKQPVRTNTETTVKQKRGLDITQVIFQKLNQDWTVKDGKVLLLDGRWMTPKELLEEVKRQLRLFPAMYDQRACVDEVEETEQNPCGTQCCIAGWMQVLTTGTEDTVPFEKINQFLTGIKGWPWLFDASWQHYSEEADALAEKYGRARSGEGRVEAACQAIDLFMDENGIK